MIRIKRGLDLPIAGPPDQAVCTEKPCTRVAVLGPDYVGMKPTMAVRVADQVKKGQVLFMDKKCPRIRYTAPGCGQVTAIHRGAKRALQSVVIQLEGDDEITFASHTKEALADLTREQLVDQLLESGLWPAIRQRPFSKVADPDTVPHSIFVTAMDTNPLAPSVSALLAGQGADFTRGIALVSKLTDGSVFVCKAPDDKLPDLTGPRVKIEEFSGPHPAGNVGTHIHFLDPVGRHKTVWHIGIQDVVAVAKLFTTGKLHTDRRVALAGPAVTEPRLIRTRIGACVDEIVQDELKPGENRVISGSVLSGFQADESLGFLGRHHQQISVVQEDRRRRFLGWLSLGYSLFSVKNIVISKLFKEKPFSFTTSTQGQLRAIVPSGTFEDLMPMDIMPLFLMRALAVDDVEEAEALGALELDEEDLSLCAFTCPSKLEFGPILRRNLTIIEKEG
ncbi:MAG: Na(+)-translocating NADH-quinone reductase subunit A [Planctomycetes bacterium]|nr:Na(+)-translocating NADH-quinone reductase subunit A [Planctomycetota bacterium]